MKSFSYLCKQVVRISMLLSLGLSLASHAALVARDLDGNLSTAEAYYDTDQNITWLADANYAQTSGYDADGLMMWVEANTWVDSLMLGGYTDWRLPNTVDEGNDGYTMSNLYQGVDAGYNFTTHSEMSYMYYEILGNIATYDTDGNSRPSDWVANAGPFVNIQWFGNWSATEYAPFTDYVWHFRLGSGYQFYTTKINHLNSWAVHTGDVGAAVVPVPAAAWLFGSALLGLVGLKRKK